MILPRTAPTIVLLFAPSWALAQPAIAQKAPSKPDRALQEPDASWPANLYVDLGVEALSPAGRTVDGIGTKVAASMGMGWREQALRLGVEFQAGSANGCTVCSPFSPMWTLGGGLRGTVEVFQRARWSSTVGLAFDYTAAHVDSPRPGSLGVFQPGLRLGAERRIGRDGEARVQMEAIGEAWFNGNELAPAFGLRIGLTCCDELAATQTAGQPVQ